MSFLNYSKHGFVRALFIGCNINDRRINTIEQLNSKLYRGCASCVHSVPSKDKYNFYCKIWNCKFHATKDCSKFTHVQDSYLLSLSPDERFNFLAMERQDFISSLTVSESHKLFKSIDLKKFSNPNFERFL